MQSPLRLKVLVASTLGLGLLALPPDIRAGEAVSVWSGPSQYQFGLRGTYIYSSKLEYIGDYLEKRTVPEISGEIFWLPHWSTEVDIAAKANLRMTNPNAGFDEGRIGLQPITFTLKYNVALGEILHPYVGFGGYHAGVSRDFPDPVVSITHDVWGWVVQGGLDLKIARNWFVNVDVRYLHGLEPDDIIGNAAFVAYKIDPVLLGIGISFRFGGTAGN